MLRLKWTNLKHPAIMGFPRPIHILCQLHTIYQLPKTADCITNYSLVMIFAARELPQYIVVPFTNSKMKDMFTYHNKCKTIKIAVQTANLEK